MNSTQKNILMLIPNFGLGGAQRSFIKLANWLSEEHNVIIVVFDDLYPVTYDVNCEIHYLHRKPFAHLNSIKKNLERISILKNYKRQIDVDISISFLEGADYLNVIAGIGEKKLISIRGSKKYDPHMTGLKGWIRKRMMIPFFYGKANKIVTASYGLEHEMRSSYPAIQNKIITIPNGYVSGKPVLKSLENKNFIIGWAGRFGDEKGLHEFAGIFIRIFKSDNSFRLMLLGQGNQKEAVKNIFISAGLIVKDSVNIEEFDFEDNHVIFCSPGKKYEEYLTKADVFVLTSPSEGFPNVIIEAMQANLPVVSTDAKWGPREILSPNVDYNQVLKYPHFGEFGILLPVINSKEAIEIWVHTLLELKINRTHLPYISKAMLSCERYSEQKAKQKWLQLLAEL